MSSAIFAKAVFKNIKAVKFHKPKVVCYGTEAIDLFNYARLNFPDTNLETLDDSSIVRSFDLTRFVLDNKNLLWETNWIVFHDFDLICDN